MVSCWPTFSNCLTIRRRTSDSQVVTQEGDTSTCFYIIRSGTVEVKLGNESLKICRALDIFGENSILGLSVNASHGKGTRMRTCVSLTNCELLRIEKEDFVGLIASHSSLQRSVHQYVKSHLQYINSIITVRT